MDLNYEGKSCMMSITIKTFIFEISEISDQHKSHYMGSSDSVLMRIQCGHYYIKNIVNVLSVKISHTF